MEKKGFRRAVNVVTILCTAAMISFVIYGLKSGIFTDRAMMEELVSRGGIWGPITFMIIQMVQVVVPVIPGGITCAVGVVVFGPWYGLLYNYIGIVAGSCINFYLARRYGQCLVKFFVKEETYNKYITWLEKGKKFDKFFAAAIFFPCAPDDVLCMIAGLTKMSWKKFSAIILLGKPASIAAYSMALVYAGGFLSGLLGSVSYTHLRSIRSIRII